jgi:hypothetical protein
MMVNQSTTKSKQRYPQPRKQAAKRQLTYLVAGAVALFALLIGLVIFVNIQRSQPVAGEDELETLGNVHIPDDNIVTTVYNSTPPTSGPHYGNIIEWGVYTQPIPYQLLLHNMEDGGVIIYYQCSDGCPDKVKTLTSIVNSYVDNGGRVVLAPNMPGWSNGVTGHDDMNAEIALTAWNRILKMDEVDEERIRAFVQKYQGIDHH